MSEGDKEKQQPSNEELTKMGINSLVDAQSHMLRAARLVLAITDSPGFNEQHDSLTDDIVRSIQNTKGKIKKLKELL